MELVLTVLIAVLSFLLFFNDLRPKESAWIQPFVMDHQQLTETGPRFEVLINKGAKLKNNFRIAQHLL